MTSSTLMEREIDLGERWRYIRQRFTSARNRPAEAAGLHKYDLFHAGNCPTGNIQSPVSHRVHAHA